MDIYRNVFIWTIRCAVVWKKKFITNDELMLTKCHDSSKCSHDKQKRRLKTINSKRKACFVCAGQSKMTILKSAVYREELRITFNLYIKNHEYLFTCCRERIVVAPMAHWWIPSGHRSRRQVWFSWMLVAGYCCGRGCRSRVERRRSSRGRERAVVPLRPRRRTEIETVPDGEVLAVGRDTGQSGGWRPRVDVVGVVRVTAS